MLPELNCKGETPHIGRGEEDSKIFLLFTNELYLANIHLQEMLLYWFSLKIKSTKSHNRNFNFDIIDIVFEQVLKLIPG